ncbi:MAG: hypothetical protein JXK51_10065 [Halothiobacillaceae bacterium]|nr:hypothetical protein [Halothiobacillaceae bacterium]
MNVLLALLLLVVGGVAEAAPFAVGSRVFIPLYSENLMNDGYADGLIAAMNPDGTVDITLSDVVNGDDKTLYGTCSPSAATQIMTAPSAQSDEKKLVREVLVDKILPWNIGQMQYIERENLSTTIQKWLGSGMAITPDSLKIADRRARELNLPRLRIVVAIAKLQVESTGGNGFPVPASRALAGSADMLDSVAKILQDHPQAVKEAAAILARTAPAHSKDLLVETVVHIAELTQKQLAQLASDNADPRKVDGYTPAQLTAIYTGWYRVMTANDTEPYDNANVAFYSNKVAQSIAKGVWPTF